MCLLFMMQFMYGLPGAEEVVDMRGGWADPDLVSGLVW